MSITKYLVRERYEFVTIERCFEAAEYIFNLSKAELINSGKHEGISFPRKIMFLYLANRGFYYKEIADQFMRSETCIGNLINNINEDTKNYRWIKSFYLYVEQLFDQYMLNNRKIKFSEISGLL